MASDRSHQALAIQNSHIVNTLDFLTCPPTEYQAVADIYNEYIAKGGSTMDQALKTADDIAAWVKKMNDREGLYLLQKDGQTLGWGIIKRYSDRAGYRLTCETSIYLRSSELRKGYGTFMKKKLLEQCAAFKYHHLVAKIWAKNTASIEYNKRLGYEIVGRQREIGWYDGEWIDVVIMQYIFDK